MFDIRQTICDEYGENDEELVAEYQDGLMQEFAASHESKAIIEKYGNVGWTNALMDYGIGHLGTSPADMTLRDFNEVVFDLIPRKVSVEPEVASQIIDELKAFWSFVQRQYQLPNAGKILESLDGGAAEKLRRKLANPENFGMAKSIVMQGMQAGFDMTTQEGNEAFMAAYNAMLANQQLGQLRTPLNDPFGTFPDLVGGFPAHLPTRPPMNREKIRKQRKAKRQARKRNRPK